MAHPLPHEGEAEPVLTWLGRHTARVRRQEIEFSNPGLEYRRLFSELWGTFLLVLVAAGGGVVGATSYGGDLTLAMKALAPGVMVMAIIFFMGTISGAHLNPAVTLAFAVRRNFPWRRVPGYLVAQAGGAVLAALFLDAMYGGILNGATVPAPGVSRTVAVLTEAVLTLGLVSVILGTATGARNIGSNGALAVGGYIGLVSVWAAPVTGASMNPARSFAPELVGGRPDELVDLPGRTARRRDGRGRLRVHPPRRAHPRRERGRAGHPRRRPARDLSVRVGLVDP
ncbi:MIP/aquaporin family protein [Nocardioides sp. Soil805]|uniref:MIP/aquaporin family protein n=1 Tax=Nocardioides sp. Soil805 TaxID=1736416 RepID=UPI000B24557F|nr:aquaporin [Nocardioides sp. Soil805]